MKWNLKKVFKSFIFAKAGLKETFLKEQNFRIQVFSALLVFCLSLYFSLSASEILFLSFSIFFVLVAELFNTAIERITDLVCQKREHNLAKLAKDISACAVLFAAINSVIVALIIFAPRLLIAFDYF